MNERTRTTLLTALKRLRQPMSRLPHWVPSHVPGGLRLWIGLMSVGFVMAALFSHGRQLLQLSLDRQGLLWLALGLGTSVLSLVASGAAWAVILSWLGLKPRWEKTVALHVSSNLRKFLPGGIWHLTTRIQVLRGDARDAGGNAVPLSDSPLPSPTTTGMALLAVLLDPLLAAVAALALVPLGGFQNGLALLCLLPLGLLLPRWRTPWLRRLSERRARQLGLQEDLAHDPAISVGDAPGGYPWTALLAQFIFILLRFGGFACCVMAFDLQLSLGWTSWLAGFALAWTAGLVVPGAPGGLGVFEAVLLLSLAGDLPEAALLAVALSYRVVVTLADVVGAALIALDRQLQTRWPGGSWGAAGAPDSSTSQ